MGCEDNIKRTTVYISKSNYFRVQKERAQNGKFSLSAFLDEQLSNYFYGDEYELQAQMLQLDKRIEEIKKEQQSIISRKTELEKRIQEYESDNQKEKQLYARFISNVSGRMKQIKELNVAPDYNQICNHFHKVFFPDNNIDVKSVKQIFHLVKNDKLTFDVFQDIRRGAFSGN